MSKITQLPDGSGFFTASLPLPKDHWLYDKSEDYPPMPMQCGTSDPKRNELARNITNAARYAIRASTMKGTESNWDPDALCQNMVVGLIGYWTPDGSSNI